MESTAPRLRSALNRPVLSSDNVHVAVISPNLEIHVFDLRRGQITSKLQLSRDIKTFLPEVSSLRWAPETIHVEREPGVEQEHLQAWLLLAGGSRLIALELILTRFPQPRNTDVTSKAKIIADYQFETQYGDIVVADFVLNHNQALVTFEMNTHASLIHLTRPQRDDIPSPKFVGHQGISQSLRRHYLALLLRTKASDQVAVFTSRDGVAQAPLVFSPGTIDAQGLQWSPDGSPALAVWDSAAYGSKVSFFTALGHALPQLDFGLHDSLASPFPPQTAGVGVTSLNWSSSPIQGTSLSVGVGGQVLVRQDRDLRSLTASSLFLSHHSPVIDGSKSLSWQQRNNNAFEQDATVFEVPIDPSSEIDLIVSNSDTRLVATKLSTLPAFLWIWQAGFRDPVCTLSFRSDIKQVLWHPTMPNIMAVRVNDKRPMVHMIHNFELKPASVKFPWHDCLSTSKWKISWVPSPEGARCPLLISNLKQFDIGLLSLSGHEVLFESLLKSALTEDAFEEEESNLVDTPSKPSRQTPVDAEWNLESLEGSCDFAANQYLW